MQEHEPLMEENPEDWMRRAKRRGPLVMLAIGGALLVLGGAWAVNFWGYAVGESPITYVRVVSVLVLGIGAGLAIAGGAALAKT